MEDYAKWDVASTQDQIYVAELVGLVVWGANVFLQALSVIEKFVANATQTWLLMETRQSALNL